jgi:hypothetical protein
MKKMEECKGKGGMDNKRFFILPYNCKIMEIVM